MCTGVKRYSEDSSEYAFLLVENFNMTTPFGTNVLSGNFWHPYPSRCENTFSFIAPGPWRTWVKREIHFGVETASASLQRDFRRRFIYLRLTVASQLFCALKCVGHVEIDGDGRCRDTWNLQSLTHYYAVIDIIFQLLRCTDVLECLIIYAPRKNPPSELTSAADLDF